MLKNSFSGGFKLELVTIFHIRFWCDSCENIAKNIIDITFFIEKYNSWEWITKGAETLWVRGKWVMSLYGLGGVVENNKKSEKILLF